MEKANYKNDSVFLISVAVFVVLIFISGVYYFSTTATVKENAQNIFKDEVASAEKSLSEHLEFYSNLLFATRGLFVASESVNREEFQLFIDGISASSKDTPIAAFSYIERVSKNDLQKFIEDSRGAGFNEFNSSIDSVVLDPQKEEYYLIKYSEPTSNLNNRQIGLDFQRNHPGTLDGALSSDIPNATEIFINPYTNKNDIMVVLPVYKNNLAAETYEERKDNVQGFVALTFETKYLLDDIFIPGTTNRLISTDIFEGSEASSGALIYSNLAFPSKNIPEYSFTKTLQVGGKYWTLKMTETEKFREAVSGRNVQIYIILGGLVFSFLVTLVTYSILNSRRRAIKLAEVMTKDLGDSEKRLRKLNRALLTISEANQTIVKARDEQKLLQSVCDILVKNAGYCLAWVGYAEDDEEKSVRVAAWSGHSDGYVEKLKISWAANNPRGRGPTGRAIRERKMVVTQDFSLDTNFSPWIKDAEDRGYKGSVVIPLETKDKFFGAINIYASEVDIFSEEELKMLQELADDLAYSISGIRTSIEKEVAEIQLKESNELLSTYMLYSPIYTFIKEVTPTEGRVIMASENYREMIGISGKNMIGKTTKELFPAEFAKKMIADDWAVIESGKVLRLDEELNGRSYNTIKFPISRDGKKLLAGYTIDITDRKKSEQALRVSEAKFRSLYGSMTEMVAIHEVVYDSEGKAIDYRIIDVNPIFSRVTGISAEKAIGSLASKLYGTSKAPYLDIYADVATTGKPKEIETYFEPMKKIFHISITSPAKGVFATTALDITEKKNAELALKISEIRYRRLFEAAKDGVLLVDYNTGMILDVNPFLINLLGYSKDTFLNKHLWEVGLFKDVVASKENFSILQKDRFIRFDDLPLETKSGKKIEVEFVANAYEAGDITIIQCNIRDITERRVAEKALADKMAELLRFQTAVNNASDQIIITDVDAKILYANHGVEQLTGYSPEEVIGKTPAVWGGQMPKDFYVKMWHTLKVDKKPFVGEIKNKRKNGQIYDAEFSVSPILNDKGEIIYFVGVERDITKIKEIERAKNEFVSLASHQLRTPLTAINWYAEMLLGGEAGKLTEKQKEYLEELGSSSHRMTELVGSLLNVSRVDLGTFTIDPRPIDITKVSKGALKDLSVKISEKKIKIVEKYAKLPEINVDPNLLGIILQNLISNAVKYTPELGTVKVVIDKQDEDVIIKVEDNGYGIPLYQQERIFEKFFRADNIIPIETDGNGLGLYMVKQILVSSGGSISFTSKEGVGSTFEVRLPLSGMSKREGPRVLEKKHSGI